MSEVLMCWRTLTSLLNATLGEESYMVGGRIDGAGFKILGFQTFQIVLTLCGLLLSCFVGSVLPRRIVFMTHYCEGFWFSKRFIAKSGRHCNDQGINKVFTNVTRHFCNSPSLISPMRGLLGFAFNARNNQYIKLKHGHCASNVTKSLNKVDHKTFKPLLK